MKGPKPRTVKRTLKVALNGTNENPYHRLGLICNPFPQIAKAEYDAAERLLAKLGGDPIPHDQAERYIRDTLRGFTEQFVALCVAKFKRDEYVTFEVSWIEEEI